MEKRAKAKIRASSRFYKHALIFAGVIGFLLIINLLTWQGRVWFHWPALAWGLLLYLQWITVTKKKADGNKDKARIRMQKHLGVYLGVIGFLFLVNVLTWRGKIWFHWPALGWGLLLFLHWAKGLNVTPKRRR